MWYRDTLKTKPTWLRICLAVRKHVGLLSLWFLVMHIIGSCMFFNQAYLKKFFVDPKAYSSKLNWMGEVSFACGVWGTGLYIILGVCSLPSVASAMTNKQWGFVFGPIAWIALCLGFVHTIVQGQCCRSLRFQPCYLLAKFTLAIWLLFFPKYRRPELVKQRKVVRWVPANDSHFHGVAHVCHCSEDHSSLGLVHPERLYAEEEARRAPSVAEAVVRLGKWSYPERRRDGRGTSGVRGRSFSSFAHT